MIAIGNVKPILPCEVPSKKIEVFPDVVMEVWNWLITTNMSGNKATIKQDDAVSLLCVRTGTSRKQVLDSGWLDIEDIYSAVGWKVEYDSPGYNETYDAYYVFSRK